jgi:GT2 family glycosyltransferase
LEAKTYVVLLNWNNTDVTTACLDSIYACRNDALQVVIVDSGSDAESLEGLKQWCRGKGDGPEKEDSWFVSYSIAEARAGGVAAREMHARSLLPASIGHPLVLIECKANLGFAAGNNLGTVYALRKGDAHYIWTLNNDTTIEPATLPELLRVMDAYPDAGAVQSLLLNFSDPRKVDSCGIRFFARSSAADDRMGSDAADLLGRLESPEPEIFGPCLASTLVKAGIFQTVGLLDENYFCIFEDADFAFRLRLNGWRPRMATRAITFHKRGLSGKTGKPRDDFSDLWAFLKKRNAVALKLKFWPFRLLLWPPGFFIVAGKAKYHALRRGDLLHTLHVWLVAMKFRLSHRYNRTELFDVWADRSLLTDHSETLQRK